MKFQINERVIRLKDVYNQRSEMQHGKIIGAYGCMSKRLGYYTELYDVQWDSGKIQSAFLPHGLDKEE